MFSIPLPSKENIKIPMGNWTLTFFFHSHDLKGENYFYSDSDTVYHFYGIFIIFAFNKCFLGPPRCCNIKIGHLLFG